MPIQYTAGPRVNVTAACATKADILNLLENNLPAAGWSVVSGGGTNNRLFQSGTTPQGLAVRARCKDNGGTCVNVSIESTDGVLIGGNSVNAGGSLRPLGTLYRLVANPFQWFCYEIATFGANSRLFTVVCCPSIPVVGAPTRAAFMTCDSQADGNANFVESLRTNALCATERNGPGNSQHMWAGSLWEIANGFIGSSQSIVSPVLLLSVMGSGGVMASGNACLRRWANDADITSDAYLSWGQTAAGDEPKIRAQIWDAIWIHNNFNIDTPATFDGHNWLALTNNQAGQKLPTLTNNALQTRATLFLAIS